MGNLFRTVVYRPLYWIYQVLKGSLINSRPLVWQKLFVYVSRDLQLKLRVSFVYLCLLRLLATSCVINLFLIFSRFSTEPAIGCDCMTSKQTMICDLRSTAICRLHDSKTNNNLQHVVGCAIGNEHGQNGSFFFFFTEGISTPFFSFFQFESHELWPFCLSN